MFGIFDIDTYNIGTSQGLRCSGHLRCSNFARKSNFAKLAMFDFKRTIAKKAELRKISRPSRSSHLRKVFLRLPACQSLPPWERWHCEAMTERASPARKSRRAAISRLFLRAILSLCLCFSPGILALSGASRQLSQRESLSIPSGSKKLPLSEELEVRFIRTGSFCHSQTHRRWRSGTLPAGRRPADSSSPRRRRRR